MDANHLTPEDNTRSHLAHFMVVGLHRRQTVRLDFAERHTVFIADNGAGKTTALYILQAVIGQQWEKLSRFDFDRIELSFSDSSVFRLSRRDLTERAWKPSVRRLADRTGASRADLQHLVNLLPTHSLTSMRVDPVFRRIVQKTAWPSSRLYDMLLRYRDEFVNDESLFDADDFELNNLRRYLTTEFRHYVIYLPTYRRVEQELRHLADREAENEEGLLGSSIKFGMKDVEKRIGNVSKSIRDHFAVTYASISGQMLHQLTRATQLTHEMRETLSNRGDIEIVLSRLANFISKEDVNNILSLYDDNQLTANPHLAFFLYNLIKSYDEVSRFDESLQQFGSTCNGYLIDKEFRYDPSSASLRLFPRDSTEAMNLNTLSSGEKQVIGVMSQVYLGQRESYIVIFDEPELSLSVDWQRKILVDIISAPKCGTLVAATHSPFVFENRLDGCARSLISFSYEEKS